MPANLALPGIAIRSGLSLRKRMYTTYATKTTMKEMVARESQLSAADLAIGG